MEHNFSLVMTLASGFSLALLFGFIAERLKIPALVGYLFAGVLIGPATPGFVADVGVASELSEIGVMLLMFGVGLHFSLEDLLAVKRIAVPGAIAQMGFATALGTAMAYWWGWNFGAAIIFGLSLSCASTVVLLKALEVRGLLDTMNGRIAVGWLVVEDLATVFALVLLPPLVGLFGGNAVTVANGEPLWRTLVETSLEISAFIALMLVVGRRVLPWLLWHVARVGSRELFTLAVITAAISIAYGSAKLFGISFALGAFFAGMVLRESEFSHRAAQESLPLRDAFAVLFFVAVGMLFEPSVLINKPLHVLGVVAIIVLGKSIAAMGLVLALRYPLNTALTVAASLAQIGEFSFILAGLGTSLGLLPAEGMSMILAGALITIALNSFLFSAIEPIKKWAIKHSSAARKYNRRVDPLSELPKNTEHKYLEGQVVLAGYGTVGQRVAESLAAHDIPFVVAEENRERVEDLRKKGVPSVSGNAADPAVLIQAHIAKAAILVIAAPDPFDVRRIAEIAHKLNPHIEIILRTRSDNDLAHLRREAVGTVLCGKEELAKGMVDHVLKRFATGHESSHKKRERLSAITEPVAVH